MVPSHLRAGREPAWLKVARRWMPLEMTTGQLYDALGWGQGNAYWKRKTEDVRLSVLIQVSQAVGAPLPIFVEEVARELKFKPRPRRGAHQPRTTGNVKILMALGEMRPLKRGKLPPGMRVKRR